MVQHAHSKSVVSLACSGLADPAEPDQAERLACDIQSQVTHRPPARPVAAADLPLALARAARGHEHQRHGDVGCWVGQHVGGIRDRDTEALAGFEIDVAHPHSEVTEHLNLTGAGLENVGAKLVGHGRAYGIVRAKRRAQVIGCGDDVALVQSDVVAFAEIALDLVGPAPRDQ